MDEQIQDDVIRLLPDSVANQIAAGEVIQRPASVIKELVENSVDAEAQNIEIVVKDAGKTLIQVVDDGKGMSTTDARMAFERHATSKIRCADDLFTLHTMGFRGEALPSIAAVSELEITSCRPCDELGTKLVIRASKVESQEPAMAMKGTNIKVKNLFYNFVARRRFLKKDSIELSHIIHEFERLALVNTDVAFKFTSNGVLLHSLRRSPLKERITALFGKTIGDRLIAVNTETSLVKIDGFVSLPSGARQRGHRQFLFVNGRNMRHPYFHKAILSCYDNLIAKDVQPHYFLNFTVAPDRIDVNIHPQKHEIKFEDEQSIWQILTAAIRQALGQNHAAATIDFNNVGVPDIPPLVEGNDAPTDIHSLTDGTYNPFELKSEPAESPQKRFDFGSYTEWQGGGATRMSSLNKATDAERDSVAGWEDFYRPLERTDKDVVPDANRLIGMQRSLLSDDETNRNYSGILQVRNKYLITDSPDGLLIIDQHRAHVNILYNDFLAETKGGAIASQQLMFGETLDLDAGEKIMLDSSIDLIERIGFRIGGHGSETVLEGMPAVIGNKNPAVVLHAILADLDECGNDVESDILSRVLITMARSAAMTGGQQLTGSEMEHLLQRLFQLPAPAYTPDGLPVIVTLSDERLAALFR